MKTITKFKYLNTDVFAQYNEKVRTKYNNAIARKLTEFKYVWSIEGRGKVAELEKTGNEITFEIR